MFQHKKAHTQNNVSKEFSTPKNSFIIKYDAYNVYRLLLNFTLEMVKRKKKNENKEEIMLNWNECCHTTQLYAKHSMA